MGSIVGFVTSHQGLIVSLLAAALWIRFRPASRGARRLLLVIVAAYTLASIYAIPYALSRALVVGFRPVSAGDLPAGRTAVVVLSAGSGSVDDWNGRRFFYLTPVAASRMWEAHRVYRMIPDAWVIASESTGDAAANRQQFTPAIHDALVQLGIPSARVMILREPANTHDEAVGIAPLVKSLKVDHVVLVTSDIHMRRSLGAFRAQGMEVIPAIARDPWETQQWWDWAIPSQHGLDLSARAVHEILGLALYRARSWLK
jgi:uncharacterized SAM-binding protein YcdF (DUF218 family)